MVFGAKARLRRWRDERRIESLCAWGNAQGWKGGDLGDLTLHEEAMRVIGLVGEVGEDRMEPGAGWTRGEIELGVILRRALTGGRLLLVDCWRDSGRETPHVVAALSTRATVAPFTIDAGRFGVTHEDGRPPAAPLDLALSRLTRPTRLRSVAGELLLRHPGLLSPERVADLARRLATLQAALPHRPDLGPER